MGFVACKGACSENYLLVQKIIHVSIKLIKHFPIHLRVEGRYLLAYSYIYQSDLSSFGLTL